ncbi:hypothetical protein FHS86_003891 [Roseimarinus sediminis]
MIPLLPSQAHWQVTQADTQPKPAKELAYPLHGGQTIISKLKLI